MTASTKSAILDKSFTLRQALRGLRYLTVLSLATYVVLLFQNAWVIKMGGVGIGEMRYADFPKECQQIVDIHRGGVGGTPFEGIQDRTIYRDVNSLIENPACWGFSIRAGIDAKSQGTNAGSQGNVRVIFTKTDPTDANKKTNVLTLSAKYHD